MTIPEQIRLFTPEELAQAETAVRESERAQAKTFWAIALLIAIGLAILFFVWHQNVAIDSINDRLYEIEKAIASRMERVNLCSTP